MVNNYLKWVQWVKVASDNDNDCYNDFRNKD